MNWQNTQCGVGVSLSQCERRTCERPPQAEARATRLCKGGSGSRAQRERMSKAIENLETAFQREMAIPPTYFRVVVRRGMSMLV
jgi:hypothetical protein